MHDFVIDQANRVVPPRIVHSQATPGSATDTRVEGQIIALAVDATSRGYDISQLLLNGVKAGKIGDVNAFFLSMQCEGNDVYFLFDQAAPGTNSIDDTLSIAAGTAALTLTSGSGSAFPPSHLPVGNTMVDFYVERLIDKTLIVKCAAGKTAVLRFGPSSNSLPGAT